MEAPITMELYGMMLKYVVTEFLEPKTTLSIFTTHLHLVCEGYGLGHI
jgi:hypothetical protein